MASALQLSRMSRRACLGPIFPSTPSSTKVSNARRTAVLGQALWEPPLQLQSMPIFRPHFAMTSFARIPSPCGWKWRSAWKTANVSAGNDQPLLPRLPRPTTLAEAARRLADQTGRDEERCRSQLQAMLMMMSRPAGERGGSGDRAFLAFKLHRFISGAGHVYSTLHASSRRRVTLDGQRFDPRDPEARLYATFFCRNCGQEYHPVTLGDDGGISRAIPRPIDETPLEDADGADQAGYLMPEPESDPDYAFSGEAEDYPDDWVERETAASACACEAIGDLLPP